MSLINILFLKKMLIIVNPIMVMLIYSSLKPNASSQRRKKDALTLFAVSSILAILFIIAGKYVLLAFDITTSYISLAGGLMIITAAWELLHSSPGKNDEHIKSKSILTPIVVPLCIGGASISIILETTSKLTFSLPTLVGLVVVVVVVYALSALACYFSNLLCKYAGAAVMKIAVIIFSFMILAVGLNITISSLASIILGYSAQ
jgi:multiple antibiotic resistance protein